MQVVEINNDLAQVRYNTEEQAFSLGDFLVISDSNADILSQIIHLETDEDNALCLTKFILNINNDQTTSLYNGYMPSLDAVVSPVSKQEISDFITPISNGINLGYLINSNLPIQLSSTILETPLYIQSDYLPACTKLINLLLTQNKIEKNVLLYDLDGTFNSLNATKYALGENFKVPLNEFFIDFIYNNDLNELDVTQKALVQDILLEIKDYIKTTDKSYIEFSTLLDVVNEQYNEQPSDALILFRNKLIEYKQLNYFVETQDDFESCYETINSVNVLFNAYKLKANWQKSLLEFLTSSLSEKTQVIAQISDSSVDELSLNNILVNKNIYPIFITNYSSQFRNLLRSKIPNMIFFQAIDQVADFPLYTNFLNVLFDNNYIIWGENTSYLSIITSFNASEKIDNTEIIPETANSQCDEEEFELNLTNNDFIQDTNSEDEAISQINPNIENNSDELENLIVELDNTEDEIIENNTDEYAEETVLDESEETVEIIENSTDEYAEEIILDESAETVEIIDDSIFEELDKTIENTDKTSESKEYDLSETKETEIEENFENTIISDEQNEYIEDSDLDFLQLEEDAEIEEIEEIEKVQETENENYDINETQEAEQITQEDLSEDISEETEFFEDIAEDNFDEIEEDIVQDYQEDIVEESIENTEEADEIFEESIEDTSEEHDEIENYSTDQLDSFEDEEIEEKNQTLEETPIEEIYQEENFEPIEEPKFQMPVFQSEQSEAQEQQLGFVEGNIVYHEKYGRGIIEKVITYGAKTLCSIQFDNIGRRLLDPTLADLKHV